jgi:hypothetical protein
MFAAARLLNYAGVKEGVSCKNINDLQMGNMLDAQDISTGKGQVLIDGGLNGYDKAKAKSQAENTLTLCLHFDESIHDFSKRRPGELLQVNVELIPLEGSILRGKDFLITACCADNKMREKLKGMDEQTELKYSKAMLKIKAYDLIS